MCKTLIENNWHVVVVIVHFEAFHIMSVTSISINNMMLEQNIQIKLVSKSITNISFMKTVPYFIVVL